MGTTKIQASVTLADVTAESVTDDKAIRSAISGEGTMTLKAGEAGIRAYGFLASVVELTEIKAKDMVGEYGADKGRLSKAGKCVRHVVAEILAPEEITPSTYQEAIEFLVETYGSLNGAYSDLFPTDPKDMTEEQAVKNLFSAVDKYDLNLATVLTLIADKVREREGE